MSEMDFAGRQKRFEAALEAQGIDLFFAPPSGDLEYLTGFARRLPSFGYSEQAHQWLAGAFFRPGRKPIMLVLEASAAFNPSSSVVGDVIAVGNLDDPVEQLARAIRLIGGGTRLGLSARTWAATTVQLQRVLPSAELVNGDDLMNGLRRIKDDAEIDALSRASAVADAVMAEIVPKVAPGVTELELASEVDYQLRRHGARTSSFDTGAFSMGRNADARDFSTRVSSHGLQPGDAVSFDFGGVVDGYCSDFGRTVYLGEPDDEFVRCHAIVIEAEAAGARAAMPGVTAAEVDRATRAVIDDAGYGQWYRHRTGHCIGLDTHERPFLSVEDRTVLEPGMAFTIEPSIFWPGRVGVRVEDLYVLEPRGCRNLNGFHHDLLVAAV
jgi:Xaa-Pro aminopeptidase